MKKRPGKQIPNFDEIEIQEWLESLDYVIRNRGPQRANFILDQLRAYRVAGRRSNSVLSKYPLHKYDSPRSAAPLSRQWRYRTAHSEVSCAGMLWLWWCGRIERRAASEATSRPSHQPRRCTTSVSITSSGARTAGRKATLFISRDTHRPESMRARFSKAGLTGGTLKTSAASFDLREGFPLILIPG